MFFGAKINENRRIPSAGPHNIAGSGRWGEKMRNPRLLSGAGPGGDGRAVRKTLRSHGAGDRVSRTEERLQPAPSVGGTERRKGCFESRMSGGGFFLPVRTAAVSSSVSDAFGREPGRRGRCRDEVGTEDRSVADASVRTGSAAFPSRCRCVGRTAFRLVAVRIFPPGGRRTAERDAPV